MVPEKVIVTGSEGFIGKEVCKFLEGAEYQVIKCSKSLGHDLTDEKFVKLWFEENKAPHLVNLFALNEHIDKDCEETSNLFNVSLESVEEFFRINISSLFSVCREYARYNKNGNIINFSSIYGLVSPDPRIYYNGRHKHVGYSVSKAAVLQLTKYLAVHLSPHIRVNCVIPGGISNNQGENFITKYTSKCPIGRMMNIEEINGTVKYLCSDAASYCTGAQFILDGGYTAW